MLKKKCKCKQNDAVSEVLSVILLITIAITVFVALHSIIVSDSGPETQQTIILSQKLNLLSRIPLPFFSSPKYSIKVCL